MHGHPQEGILDVGWIVGRVNKRNIRNNFSNLFLFMCYLLLDSVTEAVMNVVHLRYISSWPDKKYMIVKEMLLL